MQRQSPWGWIVGIAIVAVIIIAIFYYSILNSQTPGSGVATTTSAGATTTSSAVTTPGNTTQLHLDIFISGSAVSIPAMSTSTPSGEMIAAAPSGVITFSPAVSNETLGDIFAALGETISPTCIANYCASETQSLNIYVNGQLWQGDPSQIPIANDEEIAVVYGTSSQIPNPVPASYSF